MRLPSGVCCFILLSMLGEEQHLAVAGAGDQRIFRIALMLDEKARIAQVALATQTVEVALPALAIRRIGEHEIKFVGWKSVAGQRRVRWRHRRCCQPRRLRP